MTTVSTTGLNPKTIQRLRDEFKEQFSELVESSKKGWPACLPPGGGSPRASFDATSSRASTRPPTPLYFNWTDDGIPPPPPGYTPVELETGSKAEGNEPKDKEKEEDDSFESESESGFGSEDDKDTAASPRASVASMSSKQSAASGRRYAPPPRSNVFNYASSTASEVEARNKKFEACKDIAGFIGGSNRRHEKPSFPMIDVIVDKYASNTSVNKYLLEHIGASWVESASSKDFGMWLKQQPFFWNAFGSNKPDQIATVLRMFTKQLPVGFAVGPSADPKKPKGKQQKRAQVVKTAVRQQPTPQQKDEEDEDSFQNDSFDNCSEASDESGLTEEDRSVGGLNSEYSRSNELAEDSSAQIRQKDKLRQLQAMREKRMRANARANARAAETSSLGQSESDFGSTQSENQRPRGNAEGPSSSPIKTTRQAHSFMKPTAASINKETALRQVMKNKQPLVPTTMNTSLHDKSKPVDRRQVPVTVSKWAKKTSKIAQANKEHQKSFPSSAPSPLLRNHRFADGVAPKNKTEHQTNFKWNKN